MRAAADTAPTLNPLPRVTTQTRAMLVAEIDHSGDECTKTAIAKLEEDNPEMARGFAYGSGKYLIAMQGFALLYRSLVLQSAVERTRLH